jgi:hypothetical protein
MRNIAFGYKEWRDTRRNAGSAQVENTETMQIYKIASACESNSRMMPAGSRSKKKRWSLKICGHDGARGGPFLIVSARNRRFVMREKLCRTGSDKSLPSG